MAECLLTLNAVDSVDAEVALRMDPLLKVAFPPRWCVLEGPVVFVHRVAPQAHDIFQMFTLAHEFDVQELAAALQDRWSKLQQLAAHVRDVCFPNALLRISP
jgi:hypothetical protein